ncbi:MAG: Ger(x)C family spore germination protein [Oscillospiraceae bacterium]
MKKIVKIFLIVLMLFSLCGCSITDFELKNRLIIQALGIDLTNNGVMVTVEALNTEISSNPNSGGSAPDIVKIIKVEADSVSTAMRKLTEIEGRVPLLSQNRVIVFGESLCKKGVNEYIDFFLRNPQNRATVEVAVADDKAEDIVSAKMGESVIPAREIQKILEASELNSTTVTKTLYQFVNDLKSKTTSAYLPILKAEDLDDKKQIKVSGTALFDEDKYSRELTIDETLPIVILTNKADNGSFFVSVPEIESDVSLSIIKSKSKTNFEIIDNKVNCGVNIKMSLNCLESSSKKFSEFTPKIIEQIEKRTKEKIENELKLSIKKCFNEYRADPFNLGTIMWQKKPKIFKERCENWKDELKNVEVNLSVDVIIKTLGNEALNLVDN